MKESFSPENKPGNKAPEKAERAVSSSGITRRLFVGMAGTALAGKAFGLDKLEGVHPEGIQPGSESIASKGFETDPNLPPVPAESKKILKKFLSEKEARIIFLRSALVITIPTYSFQTPQWADELESPMVVDVLKSTPLANLRFSLGMSRLIVQQSEPRITKGKEPGEEFIGGMPTQERYIDQYGNEVIIQRSLPKSDIMSLMQRMLMGLKNGAPEPDPSHVIEENTMIIPPLPLVDGTETADKPIPFNFANPLNKNEKVEGFLYLLPERPVFAIDGYKVYGDIERFGNTAEVQRKCGSHLRELIKGVQGVDQIFGGERKFVKNIVLVEYGNANNRMLIENAYVERSTPKAVSVFTDILLREGGRHDVVGFHEAIHSIDIQLGISNHPHFKILFSQLSKEFFNKVKETEFLKVQGGHPEDNHLEFLASLVNSLNHSDWENKAASLDSDFLLDYLSSFLTLQQVLTECGEAIPKGAQVFSLLEKRISFLRKILGTENTGERTRFTKN